MLQKGRRAASPHGTITVYYNRARERNGVLFRVFNDLFGFSRRTRAERVQGAQSTSEAVKIVLRFGAFLLLFEPKM